MKYQYSDYIMTFTITSTLKSKLPGRHVQYGIGHSSRYDPLEIKVSVGKDAYYYSSSTNGDTETIIFKNPFWLYYAFVEEDYDTWVKADFYYRGYLELKEKGLSNLNSAEVDLYNTFRQYLDAWERKVGIEYRATVEVIVDNHFYLVSTFKMP